MLVLAALIFAYHSSHIQISADLVSVHPYYEMVNMCDACSVLMACIAKELHSMAINVYSQLGCTVLE